MPVLILLKAMEYGSNFTGLAYTEKTEVQLMLYASLGANVIL
jgi:hypothetical protein